MRPEMSFLGPNLLLFFKALLVPKKPQSSPWNNKEVMNSNSAGHGMDSFQHRHQCDQIGQNFAMWAKKLPWAFF